MVTPNPESVTANSLSWEQKVQGLSFKFFQTFSACPFGHGREDSQVSESRNGKMLSIGAQSLTILDNLTKIISKHTLKTGFMFRR